MNAPKGFTTQQVDKMELEATTLYYQYNDWNKVFQEMNKSKEFAISNRAFIELRKLIMSKW